MEHIDEQSELIGLVWQSPKHPFRLHVNDVIRVGNRLGLVIRVSECSAVVLINRPARTFITRFDKQVRLQPAPVTVRISANSEIEIVNRRGGAAANQKGGRHGRALHHL